MAKLNGANTAGRRSKRFAAAVGVAAVAGLVLAGCTPSSGGGGGGAAEYSAENPLVLSYADYAPATASVPFDTFAAEVEEKTEGRVIVEPYWGGTLLGSADLASGIQSGVADFGIFTAVHNASEHPAQDWLATLGSVGSTDIPEGVLQGYAGLSDFSYKSEGLQQAFNDAGLFQLLAFNTILNYDLICTTPVASLADAEGLRVRSGGAVWDRELAAAGFVPVTVPIEETYEGLQRGIVDCSVANPRTAMTYGFWEVAKYYTSVPFTGVNSQYVVFNQESWDKLTAEDQGILWDAGHIWWSTMMEVDGIDKYTTLHEDGPSEQNLEFVEAKDDLVNVIRAQQEVDIDAMSDSAPAVFADPKQTVTDYLETMDYWLAEVESYDLGSDDDLDLTEFIAATKEQIWDANRP